MNPTHITSIVTLKEPLTPVNNHQEYPVVLKSISAKLTPPGEPPEGPIDPALFSECQIFLTLNIEIDNKP